MRLQSIYKSNTNKLFTGVAGGIGEFLKIKPKYVRAGFIVAAIIPPTSILALLLYVGLWIVLPEKKTRPVKKKNFSDIIWDQVKNNKPRNASRVVEATEVKESKT